LPHAPRTPITADAGPSRTGATDPLVWVPRRIMALLGANGAGKSTTIKAIMGLVQRF
jgi:ABC-type transport system involved in cytochrome bd biosynthesis fused ATPase/permease subunit